MSMFIQLLNCKQSDKGRKNAPLAVVIGVLVAVVTALSGTFVNLRNNGGDIRNFWGWLTNSHVNEATHFITGKTRTRLVDLSGQWRFATGDDAERAWPSFDDSSWAQIKVPARWEDKGYKKYDGYAWYRRKFDFNDATISIPLYLLVGRIDDVDEVFVNGYRVGGMGHFPPKYATAWNRDRVYRIPEGIVREGSNVIAVRVYDNQQGGGIVRGKVGLYTTALPQPLIDLSGEWKFMIGDNSEWKGKIVDDSGFEDIQVPADWDTFGHANYDGYGWYRKTFGELPVSADETLVLLLGRIDDMDEAFLNGERIGQTGNFSNAGGGDNSPYHRINRVYEFSSSLLKETNALAVRVYDLRSGGGIYSGPIGIMTRADYLEFQKQVEESHKWNLDRTVDWLLGRG